MASATTQLEPEDSSISPSPSVTPAHRWDDLGLILAIAFAASILGKLSISHFVPSGALSYSNSATVVTGICDEIIGSVAFC